MFVCSVEAAAVTVGGKGCQVYTEDPVDKTTALST